MNTEFGQNRVQYNEFEWSYFRTENFDAYFYVGGRELAAFSLKAAENEIERIEQILDYRLSGRVELVVYNTLSELKQSNIGLQDQQFNVGGVTNITDNKLFVYFTGDHEDLIRQIRGGLANLLINEMMYGGSLQERIQNATLLNIPEWFTAGLISYISQDWSVEMDNKLKDAIRSKKYKKFNRLSDDDAIFAGHSIWKYLVEAYDDRVISNMLYLTRISRSYENAFFFVVGAGTKKITQDWLAYYQKIYEADEEIGIYPPSEFKLKKRHYRYMKDQMTVSPDGSYVAFTSNNTGAYKVWVINTKTGKVKKIFKAGFKFHHPPIDPSFPLIAWHPGSEKISIVRERKGQILLTTKEVKSKRKETVRLIKFEKVTGFDYAQNGKNIVFSAIRKGQSDLYVFDLNTRKERQLTNDFFDEKDPKFVDGGAGIIFSSNRISDSLGLSINPEIPEDNNFDIYIYDYENNSRMLKRLTKTPGIDEFRPIQYNNYYYAFLTEYNGIINRQVCSLETVYNYAEMRVTYADTSLHQNDTILSEQVNGPEKPVFPYNSFVPGDTNILSIDTIKHYRDIIHIYPVSNYKRNIIGHSISAANRQIMDVMLAGNKMHIYYSDLYKNIPEETRPVKAPLTEYRKRTGLVKNVFEAGPRSYRLTLPEMKAARSGIKLQESKINIPVDTATIDTNQYFFISEFTTQRPKKNPATPIEIQARKNANVIAKKEIKLSNPRLYEVAFLPDYFVSQIDNSVINTYYQPISANGDAFLNPGVNAMFKLGISDLFQDYKIVGGFRFPAGLNGSDYFLSYHNNKKLIDKQIRYYRQSRFQEQGESFQRFTVNELRLIYKYPFNTRESFRVNFFGRQDRSIQLSTSQASAEIPDKVLNWAGTKVEYVFDNAIPKGLNLWNGIKAKVFVEYYRNVQQKNTVLSVIGFDFRNYQKIHRQIIMATRITANASLGSARVLYYMGGVDNWLFPKFNHNSEPSTNENYVYQALATNMRGFQQNIRNGNKFAVINNEFRIPLFTYLLNRPIRSELIRNFLLVPFGDIGTAWTGVSPYGDDNSFNRITISKRPITATVINLKEPIVGGFGLGARLKLFGYYIRGDMAWGVEDKYINRKPVYYLSLSLDF